MPSSADSSRLGAVLGLIGTVIILCSYLIGLKSLSNQAPFLLGILLLLVLNGILFFRQRPVWLTIISLVLQGCGLLWLLFLFVVFLGLRCFDSCPPLTFAVFLQEPFSLLIACLGGIALNFLGFLLSDWRSRPQETPPR